MDTFLKICLCKEYILIYISEELCIFWNLFDVIPDNSVIGEDCFCHIQTFHDIGMSHLKKLLDVFKCAF